MELAFTIIHNYKMLERKPKPRYYKSRIEAQKAVKRYRQGGILAFYQSRYGVSLNH